jgi:integrase
MANKRKDPRNRVLKVGESLREDGKYQFKYQVAGKPRFVYSWRLLPSDPMPNGRRPDLSLREKEKQIGYDLEHEVDPNGKNITVLDQVDRYLSTLRGLRYNTERTHTTVRNFLATHPFAYKRIGDVKISDAKIFLINLQKNEGKNYSTICNIIGVVRPAFQMAVDDNILLKNPFDFRKNGVLINDTQHREALSKEQMEKFLDFIKNDRFYKRYYGAFFILFHTGLRISELCGLTKADVDFENRILNVDHQLMRHMDLSYHVVPTKTSAGCRKLPMTEEVVEAFEHALENRIKVKVEKMVDGYSGFIFLDRYENPTCAYHWEHRLQDILAAYNRKYNAMLKFSPHVCRHTFCTNMARAGMQPKTLQYLMGHVDIGVTMNVYTHVGLDDAKDEMERMEIIRREMGVKDVKKETREDYKVCIK